MADIAETDLAIVNILQLIIGSAILENPNRQKGLNDSLIYIRDGFLKAGKQSAAALVEAVRLQSTDTNSGTSQLNALRKRPEGSA